MGNNNQSRFHCRLPMLENLHQTTAVPSPDGAWMETPIHGVNDSQTSLIWIPTRMHEENLYPEELGPVRDILAKIIFIRSIWRDSRVAPEDSGAGEGTETSSPSVA